jgi:hypothetical protein
MKIGKNSIQGIFKYSASCQPELDDLVLHNGKLWVCTSPTPTGAPSESNKDYSLYLAPTIATEDEVMELLRSDESEWPEKAVPLNVLKSILSRVYHGLSDKGIIQDYEIDFAHIIGSTEISHGMFAVSRDHPDVEGLVSKNYGSPVFLKKYTYILDTVRYVLLELSDYETGDLWYKCCTDVKSDTDYKIVSGWKIVSPSKEVKVNIELLVNQYKARLQALYGEESKLRQNFRFSKLTFPKDQNGLCRIQLIGNRPFYGSNTSWPVLPWGLDLDYTVVILIKSEKTGMVYSESVTIPASQGSMTIGVPFGSIGEELSVIMGSNNIGSLDFSLQGIPAGWTAEIASIYFQDFYVHSREIT